MGTTSARISIAAAVAVLGLGCGDNLGGLPPPPDTDAPLTTATPLGGTYRAAPEVTLTADEPATIYYTLDGATPDTDSESGATPVTISDGLAAGGTVRFFAIDEAGNRESAKEAAYQIDRLGPAPVDDFVVEVVDLDDVQAAMTWRNPSASGFTDVLVARVTDTAGTRPEDGETYAVGDDLPGGGEVVFTGAAEDANEAGLAPGGVTYMAWARYDTGLYSDPRAGADAVPLRPQTGRLTIDVGAGTVTVSQPRELTAFQVSGGNVDFAAATTSFDVTLTASGTGILENVKLVVTSIDSLVDPSLTNADGTIADGGDHDGESFRSFGPAAMADGSEVTRTFSVNPTLVNSVFTVDFAIVRDRGLLTTEWENDGSAFGGRMIDLGWRDDIVALPAPPAFDNPTRTPDYQAYRGGVLSWDGRFAYLGTRNMPRVSKIDLTTLEVVGGLDIDIASDAGSVTHLIANQARTRLYAIVNDGMHTGASRDSVAGYAASVDRAVPDTNAVFLVEIDPDSMEETGRVALGSGDVTFRGRRGAISGDDRMIAVTAGSVWRKMTVAVWGSAPPDPTSSVYLVDLSAMAVVDADPDADDVQPIVLTGKAVASAATFTADGARIVTNSNENYLDAPTSLGAVIDLHDFAVSPIAVPEGFAGEAVKALAALRDGRVILGGDYAGLYALDPGAGTTEPFGDYTGEAIALAPSPGQETLTVVDYRQAASVDLQDGHVLYDILSDVLTLNNYQHDILMTPF